MPAMRGVAVRDVFEEDTTSGSGERLTDKFLLQPFNESERQRADEPRLSAANAVRLWAGKDLTT
jgi:hypothetical protein